MLYIQEGYPEINEIVKCTIKKIYGNTVFVILNEYEKEGVLTISEIAPGRIRNLRDHVTEGKVIICKVLRVDKNSNRIDISLRRVSLQQKKDKQEEIKKEEFAEKIYKDTSKLLTLSSDELFEKTYEEIFENHTTIFDGLYEIMLDNSKINLLIKLSEQEKKILLEVINSKIKKEEVVFKETFKLYSKEKEGLNIVKKAISDSLKPINYEKFSITYLAAGSYRASIIHEDIKSANKIFGNFKENLIKEAKTNNLKLEIKE